MQIIVEQEYIELNYSQLAQLPNFLASIYPILSSFVFFFFTFEMAFFHSFLMRTEKKI